MIDGPRARLFELESEPVSAVSFVQDYVELHFDGKVLRALYGPRVATPDGSLEFPAPGSRDALCRLIGRVVTDLDVEEGKQIVLKFEGGFELSIPLTHESKRGPEAAHYVSAPNAPVEVW